MTTASAVLRSESAPTGWWGRSCSSRACLSPKRTPPPFVPVTDLARPVECVESYITTGVPPVRSQNHKALLMRAGVAELRGPFGTHTVRAGDLVLLSAGVVCGSVSLAPVEVVCAYYNPGFIADQVRWTLPADVTDRRTAMREVSRVNPTLRSFPLDPVRYAAFDEQFERLLRLNERGGLGDKFVAATQLLWLIGDLLEGDEEQVPVADAELRPLRREVRAILELLQRDYARPWTTAALARRVSLSESALRRAFLRAIGMSPREYLHQVRLMRFEQLVAITAVSIRDAARRVGWDSGDYARRVFVRNHGLTPREYRAEAVSARQRCAGYCLAAAL